MPREQLERLHDLLSLPMRDHRQLVDVIPIPLVDKVLQEGIKDIIESSYTL